MSHIEPIELSEAIDESLSLIERFTLLKRDYQHTPYLPISLRRAQLKALLSLLKNNAEVLAEAISKDFSYRSTDETFLLEVFPSIRSIGYCLKHLTGWTKKRKRSVSWLFKPANAYLFPQPLGVIGIMVPWNYPLFLSLIPIAFALASGNRAMVKMSELSPHTGEALRGLLQQVGISEQQVCIINGDITISKAFSRLPFGHLLFTGSTAVGRHVMMAASENLTPVTLELGGKSPVIISHGVSEHYLTRIFTGKLFNAGQTCIAPDYLLIPEGQENVIQDAFTRFIDKHYPALLANPDYSSIISPTEQARLKDLIADAKAKGARVVVFDQGSPGKYTQKLPVYLVFNVTKTMHLMQEEIFGPILPVIGYQTFNHAIDFINKIPNPLALYYFGQDANELQLVQQQTLSGALCINDTIMHVAIDDLPFGGVGMSGMGAYHGQEGFDLFSKLKPVLVQRRLSPVSWLYPPFGKRLRLLMRFVAGIRLTRRT